MPTLKQLSQKEPMLSGGHRLCAGCAHPIIVKQFLAAADDPVVAGVATGCLEVSTTVYPYTAWKIPYIHNAFENAAATVGGVEAAFKALKRRGKIDKEMKFVTFGGDGGTYDIGFQSLSGAMERGHNMVYVCLDNGAYMNTGIQRSSATPIGAETTTSPVGEVVAGKQVQRKDLTAIMAAHNIPYVAQASPSHWNDLVTKAQKAMNTEGPAFVNVISPCPRGWRFESAETIEMARLAVETCYWPLFEVVDGKWRITYTPREKKPLVEWLKAQGRFRHLLKPENAELLAKLQESVDRNWEELQKKAAQ